MNGTLSFGEVEALARRAARGAGLPWDLADEAGRAVRILCAVDIDGCRALADLLAEIRVRRDTKLVPQRLQDRVWSAPGGALCPIRTGAALSDIARHLPPDGVGLLGVMVPALILPFAADVARIIQGPVTLSWHSGILSIGPDGLPHSEGMTKLVQTRQTGLHLHPGGPGMPPAPPQTRARPDAQAWAELVLSAARTVAPPDDPE